MTVEIISRSISTEVWERAGIKLTTPGFAVGHATEHASGPIFVRLGCVRENHDHYHFVDPIRLAARFSFSAAHHQTGLSCTICLMTIL